MGGTGGQLANVAPSATSGVPLISGGSSANPSFGTAVVAGGGTGATSFTAYTVLTGGTTTTGPVQNVVAVGSSGQALISQGAAALPIFGTVAKTAGGSGSTNFTGNRTLLFTTTASSSANIPFVSWTTGYLYYVAEFYGIQCATNATTFNFSVSTNAGSTYASQTFDNCGWEVVSNGSIAAFTDTAAGSGATFNLGDVQSNASTASLNGYLYCYNLDSASIWKTFLGFVNFTSTAATSAFGQRSQNVQIRLATAVNGIRFQYASGNIAAGTINWYGVSA